MLKLSGSFENNNHLSFSRRMFKVTTNHNLPKVLHDEYIFLNRDNDLNPNYQIQITFNKNNLLENKNEICILLDDDFKYLSDGDVLVLDSETNRTRVLYRTNSPNNYILLTERCNHYCLMCSQPPKNIDDSFLMEEAMELIDYLPSDLSNFGLTGGEPTLYGEKLVSLVNKFKIILPNTQLDILTNGRAFKDKNYALSLADINHSQLRIAIPVYSSNPTIHDYVVQAKGAFDETIKGILELKKYNVNVEIRVVLHKITIPELIPLAKFIARNLRFVDHVALMGLEITGFTRANFDLLWVDPWEYKNILSDAVSILNDYSIHTSIYNNQLCLINSNVKDNYQKSISDWKNEYIGECDKCTKKGECGGFFSSAIKYGYSKHIRAFKNEVN
ncbi:His-Xaa-Ser system radical SAM maturase HxsC [Pseudomonadota bacterium]|nr:His-Xaa-Ser system radical SAM maturase HxsC [Pseudomonadota bacterium]